MCKALWTTCSPSCNFKPSPSKIKECAENRKYRANINEKYTGFTQLPLKLTVVGNPIHFKNTLYCD